MNQSLIPEVEIEPRKVDIINNDEPEPVDIYKDYSWKETELYGWAFATTNQTKFNADQWIYLEELKWVWSPGEMRHFIYSYDHGWLYNTIYRNKRVLYWYDKRIWAMPYQLQ